MADTNVLRTNAVNRTASIGEASPGAVKTGALPLVDVRTMPGGPPVQEGQQRAVTILPPKDDKGPVAAGAKPPTVNIKMTTQGPQVDDGRNDGGVVILPSKTDRVASGALPMVNVQMTATGPLIENQAPAVPPRIAAAPSALSQPREGGGRVTPAPGGPQVAIVDRVPIRGGSPVARPGAPIAQASVPAARGGAPIVRNGVPIIRSGPPVQEVQAPQYQAPQQPQQAMAAAPQQPQQAMAAAPQVELAVLPEMSTDQLMLVRHLVDKYLGEIRTVEAPVEAAEGSSETLTPAAAVTFAESTLALIDNALVATAARAEALANTAAAEAEAPTVIAKPSTVMIDAGPVKTATHAASNTAVPQAPRQGYVMRQRNGNMAPRGVRGPATKPMLIVSMDGKNPVVHPPAEPTAAPLEGEAALEAALQDAATAAGVTLPTDVPPAA